MLDSLIAKISAAQKANGQRYAAFVLLKALSVPLLLCCGLVTLGASFVPDQYFRPLFNFGLDLVKLTLVVGIYIGCETVNWWHKSRMKQNHN